jgi:hypothetical protein
MTNARQLILSLLAPLAASCLWSAPASAQGLKYFYCYAIDDERETVFVSDMHEVGPVSERSTYGAQFASYLKVKRGASASVRPYCVMRSSEQEIQRGRSDLAGYCPECGGITRFEDVAWLREGTGARALLAGKLIERNKEGDGKPSSPDTPQVAKAPARKPAAAEPEPVEDSGLYLLGRRDATEVTYSVNEENGAYLARQKADLKGGKWSWIINGSTCVGWVAIAYASNGTDRWYYAAQGADSEGEASLAALKAAEEGAKRQDGAWITGVLVALQNNYRPKSIGPLDVAGAVAEDGVIETTKGLIRRQVVSGCPTGSRPFVTVGVRG